MQSTILGLLAVAGAALAQDQFTATQPASVYAAQATALTESPTSNVKGKAFDRLVIVWLENTDYTLAAKDPNLQWLAAKGITLENYFGVTHPSEPNYVASHGGDYFGMNNDNLNFIDANVSTVVDLLEDKNISWGEYQEDMPYSGFEGFSWVNQKSGANDYVRKHNPAVIYNKNTQSTDRLAKMKNLTMFYEDLENETLPQWMFITPNMTSDGHDTTVTVAGTWTRNFLEPLLDDPRFMNNTLVLVTFDESGTYTIQNRVFTFLIGDAVPDCMVGTTDSAFYNHYSEISTVEANWGLDTLGRWDVGANVFSLVAAQTGDEIREWSGPIAFSDMYYNRSYDGIFNSEPANPTYPKPNLCLVQNGRPVADFVKNTWTGSRLPDYYNNSIQVPDGDNPPVGFAPLD